MERETIFGGGGDHKQRKVVPSIGGETICEGKKESIFKERKPFLSSVFPTINKMLPGCSNGNPVK